MCRLKEMRIQVSTKSTPSQKAVCEGVFLGLLSLIMSVKQWQTKFAATDIKNKVKTLFITK